jgi:hypothetical protein
LIYYHGLDRFKHQHSDIFSLDKPLNNSYYRVIEDRLSSYKNYEGITEDNLTNYRGVRELVSKTTTTEKEYDISETKSYEKTTKKFFTKYPLLKHLSTSGYGRDTEGLKDSVSEYIQLKGI